MGGFFLTLEGTEGSGKSTLLRWLANRLTAEKHKTTIVREPGGTEVGEQIRKLLKHGPNSLTAETELLLMNASRAQLVREIIRPALDANHVVVCDRFHDSTVAYQCHGRGLNADLVQACISTAIGETFPDLTLLLHIPIEISEERRIARGKSDRFESADRAFFQRVATGYRTIAESHADRIVTLDGTLDPDSIAEMAWSILSKKIQSDR
ncbi:MAG: dTMP kinase [Verrucomicrobiales bacterium]|nr:dTMP kinase [Verrucomicrobiales bacterium]|tara:strand:+ start:1309 stop:1935 length:627 start_codon:yes stop_codon:yes gene_type:complete